MSNNKVMEKLLDDLIKEATILASGDKELTYEKAEHVKFSKEHEEKMELLFASERRKINKAKRIKTIKYYLIASVIIILAMIITILSVSALRIKFMNLIIDMSQTNSKIEFRENATGDKYKSDELSFNYLPEGFQFENKNISQDRISLKFNNDNGDYFDFSVRKIDTENRIDTENADVSRIKINGYDGLCISKDDVNIIVWHDDSYVYRISGNIAQKELIKIGESAEKHNN